LVAVHAARLIMVCAVKPAGRVAVRDLASGEVSEIAVGELSARPTTTHENDASRLHADVVRASPARYRTAERRERLGVAALAREGPLNVAVEQTSAASGIGPRSLSNSGMASFLALSVRLSCDRRGTLVAGWWNLLLA
jgi:hypothetical protein